MSELDFFDKLGFSKDDFRNKKAKARDNASDLQAKFDDFYYYEVENIQTSFFIIEKPLSDAEFDEFKTYLWNNPDVNLFFYRNKQKKFELHYSKTYDKSEIIDTFVGTDVEKINQIRKSNFDTGLLWHYYWDKIENVKKKRVDEELKIRLTQLKTNLSKLLPDVTHVQALIDRTLFIKFLEDRHILNSNFYGKFFEGKNYAKLLEQGGTSDELNLLFKYIQALFNQQLFDNPEIDAKILNDDVLKCLSEVVTENPVSGNKINLFPFRFDVLPTEFISHIYEVFLETAQKENGIFYTPKNLAELIVERTITHYGSVLDPACGSGMFLILAFQQLKKYYQLDTQPMNAAEAQELIDKRCEKIKACIFGIEKEKVAQRLAIFSLYLEIIRDIDPKLIKELINNLLETIQGNDLTVIKEILSPIFKIENFDENIVCANTLDLEKKPLDGKKFDFIVGNPPFTKKLGDKESVFWKRHDFEGKKASEIVGGKQLSQLFMLKIKEWGKANTRFGFVQNSSNLSNENADNFIKFFFSEYKIEELFELSQINDILFLKAKETVFSAIFTNEKPTEEHHFSYFSPEFSHFSKIFRVIVIDKDKEIILKQKDVAEAKVFLRDYLVGNEWDRAFLKKTLSYSTIGDAMLQHPNYSSLKGVTPISNKDLLNIYKIKSNLTANEIDELHEKFKTTFLRSRTNKLADDFRFIEDASNICRYYFLETDAYISKQDVKKENFQRPRNSSIYKGEKILLNRFGKELNAVFTKEDIVFSTYIYGLKLSNRDLYWPVTAILNSFYCSYFVKNKLISRNSENFSNLTIENLKKIPLPNFQAEPELVEEITNKVKEITEVAKYLSTKVQSKAAVLSKNEHQDKYEQLKNEIDELVFDLYDLNVLEKQRIRDFFVIEKEVNSEDLKVYQQFLVDCLQMYFRQPLSVDVFEGKSLPLKMSCISLFWDNTIEGQQVTPRKVALSESYDRLIISSSVYTSQDFLFGENCIFILKEKNTKLWTKTKAFEDAQFIIKTLYKL